MKTNIKAISELLKLDFFIPSYQRGYRWDEHQVTELLDDIWDFYTNGISDFWDDNFGSRGFD